MPFKDESCYSCSGRGYVWPDTNTRCVWCNGSGVVTKYVNETDNDIQKSPSENKGSVGCMVALIFCLIISSPLLLLLFSLLKEINP
jgi:hypothetical protein